LRVVVTPIDDGARLDQWLARALHCSRREAQRLIAEGAVRVGGSVAKKGMRMAAGAEVEVAHAPAGTEEKRPVPEALPLVVLHQDAALVAVDKPAGMPTHPLRAGERGTVANRLLALFPECATVADDAREGGVAHRLDVDTSGVLVAARTRQAWLLLRRAFADGLVEKEYLALVAGAPPERGTIEVALAHAGRRVRVSGERDLDALPASTRYEVVTRGRDASGGELALVRAWSSSGRMHQIRAHLAHLGYPLVGDPLYGGPPAAPGTHGHFLHAARLGLPHPTGGAPLTVEAPLPEDRAAVLTAWFGWQRPRS
jgi:23S rRNA pseudouridine1911/1915/1917 synthase